MVYKPGGGGECSKSYRRVNKLTCKTCKFSHTKLCPYWKRVSEGLFENKMETIYLEASVETVGCGCHSSAPIPDDPDADMTDFAHPAFWRGNDAAVAGMIGLLRRIKSGKETKAGKFSNPELTELRDWIIDLRDKS